MTGLSISADFIDSGDEGADEPKKDAPTDPLATIVPPIEEKKAQIQEIKQAASQKPQETNVIKEPTHKDELEYELDRLQNLASQQRKAINSQKETLKLLIFEAFSHEEMRKLKEAVNSKSPLAQDVAATPIGDSNILAELRNENHSLRRELSEQETKHMNEMRELQSQFSLLIASATRVDGCEPYRKQIAELEEKLKGVAKK